MPQRYRYGQTMIKADTPDGVHCHLVVDSAAFRNADAQAVEDLQTLLRATIRRRGGDPGAVVFSAEPVGPQIELAAVDGRTL